MLRAVRVTPAAWPDLDMECRADANALGAMQAGILAHDRMVEAAACRRGNVLVFWPPLRHTYLPHAVVPLMPEGAEDSDSGSDDEVVPTDLRRPAADGSVRNGDGDVVQEGGGLHLQLDLQCTE